ncbi:MAG: BglI family type II restriction endonuclease [Caldilineales bacterium]|nr:BglI family type II restriction endonuclease [Caldilineales bacterium]MCW5857629.1 BglI family type II restriction endonuclease [Caldilineales bacterium]
MLIHPQELVSHLTRLEDIERASLRLVVQALLDFRQTALEIFTAESDLAADIGEDITREALDKLGMSRIEQRLFGKIDFKRARYLFHPEYAIKQALFVDSKAEKIEGQNTATLQTSQFSMSVRQMRSGEEVNVSGKLPPILELQGDSFITTTIFVKYNYRDQEGRHHLESMTVAALPNGLLQENYNPSPLDSIWLVGRNAPTLGEEFRVRLSFARLKKKANWRVQRIPLPPGAFVWES